MTFPVVSLKIKKVKKLCPLFIIILVFNLLMTCFAPPKAIAQGTTKVRKTTTTVTTKEVESDTDDESVPVPPVEAPVEPKESVKTANFGSKSQSGLTGCKTEALSNSLVKDLKADCSAWVKDQKSELKAKFLTSSCEESCDDCGMSLKRCSVKGSVHYLLK